MSTKAVDKNFAIFSASDGENFDVCERQGLSKSEADAAIAELDLAKLKKEGRKRVTVARIIGGTKFEVEDLLVSQARDKRKLKISDLVQAIAQEKDEAKLAKLQADLQEIAGVR